MYDAKKRLCNGKPRNVAIIKNKHGKVLTRDDEIRKRWGEHFEEVLNRPPPTSEVDIEVKIDSIENIKIGYITRNEIKNAMYKMKRDKAAGIDSLTTEFLNVDKDVTTEVLYELFTRIWEKEELPEDWSKRLIVKLPKRGDLTECDNWRGITFMPVVMKLFGSAIINGIREGVDNKLRNEQAGYRKGRKYDRTDFRVA